MVGTISHIIAASSDISVSKTPDGRNALGQLKPGQIVKAAVEQAPSAREAILIIQGKKVLARTHIPLKPGDSLLLRLEQNAHQPTFKLVENSGGRFIHLSPDLLSRSGPYGLLSRMIQTLKTAPGGVLNSLPDDGLAQLERLTQKISLNHKEIDPGVLKDMIQKSGMTWENKVMRFFLDSDSAAMADRVRSLVEGDVKALTLRLARQLNSAGPDGSGAVRTFLENLEHLQLLNERSSRESGRYLFPLPFSWDDTHRFGQLLIDLGSNSDDRTDEKKDRFLKVSFLLEMSNLGHVLADFSILKKALSGAFCVESDEIKDLVKANIPELKEKMKRTGFDPLEIGCRVMARETLETTSLTDRLIHPDEGVLNIVI